MDGKEMVAKYLERRTWRVKENSNVNYSAQSLNMYLAGGPVGDYWLEEVYPEKATEGYHKGQIHIHDLHGGLTTYCVGWDLADLLINGFGGVSGAVQSGPPKHLSTALMQIVNFLFSLQGEAAGAVALSNWDTLLSPFVKADGLSYRQVKQAVQEFVFNMNVPTRAGGQSPFSNITLDILPSPGMLAKPAIVGGEPQDYTYGDLREEQRMLVKAFFEVMCEGDAAGRPFTFPIPTIDVNHEFPWDDEMLDPMWEATAKYGVPYFANYLSTNRSRDESRSMCCRLRLDVSQIPRKGGVFASHPLTGSLGVITLNLPRLAIESGHEDGFLASVKEWTRESISALWEKRKFLEKMTDIGLHPYSRHWLRGVKEGSGGYWSQHFSTVGLVGMHEACQNLGIAGGITGADGHALADKTLQAMLGVIGRYSKELINLEATPAEGACYRLAKHDLEEFGSRAHHSGTKDAPYYTGSTLYPNEGSDDVFNILVHQERLQDLYTGGTVFHTWLGERIDPQAGKAMVKKVFENFRIPYMTLTPTFSVCPTHGYLRGEVATCRDCGTPTEVYSRVVGYLRPVQQWNVGKQQEFKERKVMG